MKPIAYSFMVLLISTGRLAWCASSAPENLNMVIFDTPPAPAKPAPVPVRSNSIGEPKLDMVVFSDDAPVEQQTQKQAVFYDDKQKFTFSYEVASGYQHDQMNWNVASPSGTPDPLTEAKWEDVQMGRVQGEFKIATPGNLVFKGGGSYAWTVDGQATEISYLGDQGQGVYSRIEGNSDQGYAWKAGLGAGYQFKLNFAPKQANQLVLTPLVGYAWQKQEYRLQNGQQRVAQYGVGSDPGLQNSYVSEWQGPWLGFDAQWTILQKHQLFSSFEYHWDNYSASGNWMRAANLLHPESFTHDADATGWVASAGYRYRMDKKFGWQMAFDYQKWTAKSGIERLFLTDKTAVESTLNRVERETLGVNVGVSFDF